MISRTHKSSNINIINSSFSFWYHITKWKNLWILANIQQNFLTFWKPTKIRLNAIQTNRCLMIVSQIAITPIRIAYNPKVYFRRHPLIIIKKSSVNSAHFSHKLIIKIPVNRHLFLIVQNGRSRSTNIQKKGWINITTEI